MSEYQSFKTHCLRNKMLFEDPEFPAIDESLFTSKSLPVKVIWKRPKEICPSPSLFVGGASRFDISQGMLGNCWFLSALAALSLDEHLLHKVIPPEQRFDEDYAGIFRFNFWQYGDWREVVVDDRLPTYNNKLIFAHSTEKNEFWSALLEKAYAKLHGSYEALKGGQTSEAMEDFTGGLVETFRLGDKAPADLFSIMLKSYEMDSQLCCSVEAKPNEIEAKMDNGLIKGHAYTISDIKKVEVSTHDGKRATKLVRLRNPWGCKEWTGLWGDNWEGWSYIPEEERTNLGLIKKDDGEFWMGFEDWVNVFTKLEMCYLSPKTVRDSGGNQWNETLHLGMWQKGFTAGGCRNFIDTFASNPQFRFRIDKEDDDSEVKEKNGSVVIALMQKGRRKMRKVGAQNLTIGFAIYEYEGNGENLDKDYFLYHKSVARSSNFVNSREVSERFKLPLGQYCVIPSTFKAQEEGDFLLRIYSAKPVSSKVIDDVTAVVDPPKKALTTEQTQALKNIFAKLTGDVDRSGKLDFEEFSDLWPALKQWRETFAEFDKDKSGKMSSYELKEALKSVGFSLSMDTLGAMVLRYADQTNNISFDGFFACVIKLKHMFNHYQKNAKGDYLALSLDDFLKITIYS